MYAVRRRWPTSQPCAAVTLRNTHTLTMATSASKGIPVLWQRVTLEGQEKAKEPSRTRDKGSPREAAGLRPSNDCSRSISQQMWVHSTHTLPSLQSSRRNFPRANKTREPPPPVLSESESELSQSWRQILKNSPRWNTINGRKKMRIGHHSWLKLGQPFWWLKDKRKLALQERKN